MYLSLTKKQQQTNKKTVSCKSKQFPQTTHLPSYFPHAELMEDLGDSE